MSANEQQQMSFAAAHYRTRVDRRDRNTKYSSRPPFRSDKCLFPPYSKHEKPLGRMKNDNGKFGKNQPILQSETKQTISERPDFELDK
ncbi:hypothetical protein AVEN_88244-1 [Araneus ventricosus]|uniref:Uncharacterized protein n=1 Tax=Araneus ventricosus TaxID=182803 RepID=A0A4Y2IMJ6_ARAVE|nr:hypothetical protein AVEN_88244-1 [Araneus ventricosus]